MFIRIAAAFLTFAAAALPQGRVYPAARQGGSYMHNYYLPPAPSSTPWAPAWSPDGKSIAVGLHGSIWSVDPATGVATELTYNNRYHSMPNWSPDGKWIIYTADEGHRRIQLEILNMATGESQALTNDDQVYMDPVFSPDGSRLAYVSTQPNGNFNLHVRAFRDGQLQGEAIALTEDNRYPRNRLYFGPWDMHIQPAWSKDGSEVLFVSNRGVPLGSGDIWRMPVRAKGMENAVPVLKEQSLYRTQPHISIDGKRFIYSSSSGAGDQFNHLYVLPVAGGAPYKMTFGDHDDFHPRWSPDGEHIAYISNQGGLPQLWVMDAYGGGKRRIDIREMRWKRPMGKLRVSVVDEATGRPTGARIQGQAADGKFYAPHDAYSRIGQYGVPFFHTTGEFTLEVPPGTMTLEATKGFEHQPVNATVTIRPGQTTQTVLRLRRSPGWRSNGWYSGSTHVHMNYGGNLRNTLENLMMMARGEDLNVIGEQVANKDNRILDWQYFVPGGGEHPVSRNDPDTKVIVGQEYRPPFYGHVGFLGLRDNLISPFTTGYEGTGIESLYPSNTDMFRKARAQGAFTFYVHPMSGDNDPLEGELGVAKGFPVDAALGTVDALEWSSSTRAQVRVWHHALNNDLKIIPVGGEDSISNLHWSKVVGSLRTYVYTGGKLSVDGWFDNLRKGHSFFTSGPLLEFRVNNQLPGQEIRLPAGGGKVKIEARARSIAPLTRVLIYHNGKVLRELPLIENGTRAEFTGEIAVNGSGWYSLYAEGESHRYLDTNYPQAGTNAVRVYVGDGKIRNRESAEYFVRWIDKLRGMAEEWPWWRSQAEKDHVFAQFNQAREVYLKLAAEAQSVSASAR